MSEIIKDNAVITVTVSELKNLLRGVLDDYDKQKAASRWPTKEEIMNIRDPAERQAAIRANLELFKLK